MDTFLEEISQYGFWVPTVLSVLALLWWTFGDPYKVSAGFRNWVLTGLVAVYFSKIFAVLFYLLMILVVGSDMSLAFYKSSGEKFLEKR